MTKLEIFCSKIKGHTVTYRPHELHQGDVIEKWGKNWTIRNIEFHVEPTGVSYRIFISHDQERVILIVDGEEPFKLIYTDDWR